MRTGGYFDARAGGRLDPSGLVKGWAVDRAAALLDAAGVARWCVDAGGDVRVRGGGWRIGVRHPDDPLLLAGVLVLDDGAVATSGAYERGPHVLDPHTRRPPEGVRSVTVVGPELATADAYATAAFAMGRRGPAWTARQRGHDAMTILDGDRVLATPGFLARCPGGSPAASCAAPPERAAPPIGSGSARARRLRPSSARSAGRGGARTGPRPSAGRRRRRARSGGGGCRGCCGGRGRAPPPPARRRPARGRSPAWARASARRRRRAGGRATPG